MACWQLNALRGVEEFSEVCLGCSCQILSARSFSAQSHPGWNNIIRFSLLAKGRQSIATNVENYDPSLRAGCTGSLLVGSQHCKKPSDQVGDPICRAQLAVRLAWEILEGVGEADLWRRICRGNFAKENRPELLVLVGRSHFCCFP